MQGLRCSRREAKGTSVWGILYFPMTCLELSRKSGLYCGHVLDSACYGRINSSRTVLNWGLGSEDEADPANAGMK